ncbi:MAG: sulfatase-like hydrolase/transferase, partial [Rubripirellula sp.]
MACYLLMSVCFVNAADSTAAESARPNILLIVSDDQRPDTIAALGNEVIQTPNLDQLVNRGTVFPNAVCGNPICTPSRAELMTGSSGLRNGVFDFGRVIDPALPTLPEPFAAAGYQTWYSGKWHNNGRPHTHGYANTNGLFTGGGGKWWKDQVDYRGQPITGYKGWIFRDRKDKPLPEQGVGLTPAISERFADAAIEVVQSSDEPFFLHLNFTAPHDPLLVPPGFEGMYDPKTVPLPANFASDHPFDHGNRGGRDEVLLPIPRTESDVRADLAAYYAVISHMDQQIGRVLDALESADKTESTIIVFCSDHGLAMGSHGLRGK